MRRTQLQLDEPTYQILRAKAFEQGTSIAALVRDILRQHLGVTSGGSGSVGDFKFVASGHSAPGEFDPISENHDGALDQDFAG